jgi:hypothetical protein
MIRSAYWRWVYAALVCLIFGPAIFVAQMQRDWSTVVLLVGAVLTGTGAGLAVRLLSDRRDKK